MVKVRVTKRYSDLITRKIQEVNDILEVDEKRAAHLVKEGVAKFEEESSAKAGKTKVDKTTEASGKDEK